MFKSSRFIVAAFSILFIFSLGLLSVILFGVGDYIETTITGITFVAGIYVGGKSASKFSGIEKNKIMPNCDSKPNDAG